MLLYLAQYLSGEKSIKEMWEVDSKFIRLDADHVVAGTGRGSFPGGDLANSWPIKSFNQKTAMKALSAFDLEIIKEVLISIKMRNVLKENEGLH